MKTKKDRAYSFEHTKERALERYGIELTEDVWNEWAKLANLDNRIQTDRANQQDVYRIDWQGRQITIVCKTSQYGFYVSTVLPEGMQLMFGKQVPFLCMCGRRHLVTEGCSA